MTLPIGVKCTVYCYIVRVMFYNKHSRAHRLDYIDILLVVHSLICITDYLDKVRSCKPNLVAVCVAIQVQGQTGGSPAVSHV